MNTGPFHAFATRTVITLYQQADAEKERPNLVAEMMAELRPMIEAAEEAARLNGPNQALLTTEIIPAPFSAFARKWYRTLHDDYQARTVDAHYLQNVRRIGTELTCLFRTVSKTIQKEIYEPAHH